MFKVKSSGKIHLLINSQKGIAFLAVLMGMLFASIIGMAVFATTMQVWKGAEYNQARLNAATGNLSKVGQTIINVINPNAFTGQGEGKVFIRSTTSSGGGGEVMPSAFDYAIAALNGDITLNSSSEVMADPSNPYEGHVIANGRLIMRSSSEIFGAATVIDEISMESSATVYADAVSNDDIQLSSSAEIDGNATSNGNISLQSGSDIYGDATAAGTITKNSGSKIHGEENANADVEAITFPDFPEVDVSALLADAEAGLPDTSAYLAEANAGGSQGTTTISSDTTLGPKHITGDLVVNSSKKLTLQGTVYVDGRITVSSSAIIQGAYPLVAAGNISVSSSGKIKTSGMPLITTSGTFTSSSNSLVEATVYCPNGNISVSSGGTVILGEQHTTGNLNISSSAVMQLAGVLYVDKSVTMSSSAKIYGPGTLVAEGNIILSGSTKLDFDHIPLIISTNGNIETNSNSTVSGLLYAPSGYIELNSSSSVYGCVVGESIILNSSSTVEYPVEIRSRQDLPGHAVGTIRD